MVFFAGRDAARGDDQIVLRGSRGKRVAERRGAVRPDPEIGDDTAEPLQQRFQHDAVGVVDHAGVERLPGLAHLVARRQQRGAQRPKHRQPVLAEGRRKPEIGRLEPTPGGKATAPFATSSPAWRRLAAFLMPGGICTRPSSRTQSSCIRTVSGPSGIGAPVKMRIASPRSGLAAERMAGGGAPGHRQ